LIIDSISRASIGIQWVSIRVFESRPAIAAYAPKPSADTLLRHALSHYIPDPILIEAAGSCLAITTA
jgi:hypothetical protein